MRNPPDFNHLYQTAESQAGYFTAGQAQGAGFSWERLSYYVSRGKFIRIKRGIYRLVQFPGSSYEDLFVAWLTVGRDSVISHESALYLHNLSDVLPGEIHVTMPRTGSRRRKGIRLHTKQILPEDVTWREGLPVTNAARTIVDVANSGLAEELVRQAVQESLRRGLLSETELLSSASRQRGRAKRMLEDILNSETK